MPDLDLLIQALATESACVILGAGASAPDVPTMGQLPAYLASYSGRLSGFPAGPLPASPLKKLVEPLLDNLSDTNTALAAWKTAAMTPATIAVILEDLIATAHWRRLPQYDIFGLLPRGMTVVSFNWDGLAEARIPQQTIHPHGALRKRPLIEGLLDGMLLYSQLDESHGVRSWLIPGLVMPGEEDGRNLRDMRERILALWLAAPVLIVVGYGFGLGSTTDYDRVWRDTFVEAMRCNSSVAIHIIDPEADRIRGDLCEMAQRSVNVFAWPLRWKMFAIAALQVAADHGIVQMYRLCAHSDAIGEIYGRALREGAA